MTISYFSTSVQQRIQLNQGNKNNNQEMGDQRKISYKCHQLWEMGNVYIMLASLLFVFLLFQFSFRAWFFFRDQRRRSFFLREINRVEENGDDNLFLGVFRFFIKVFIDMHSSRLQILSPDFDFTSTNIREESKSCSSKDS